MCEIIGNIFWFFLGGFVMALSWFIVSVLCCITIIGIPVGLVGFKMASLALCPFGKEVVYPNSSSSDCCLNVIWCLLFGLVLGLFHFILGIFFCITIIFIPFGIQHFKLAKVAFCPAGAKIMTESEKQKYLTVPNETMSIGLEQPNQMGIVNQPVQNQNYQMNPPTYMYNQNPNQFYQPNVAPQPYYQNVPQYVTVVTPGINPIPSNQVNINNAGMGYNPPVIPNNPKS